MDSIRILTALGPQASPARTRAPERRPLRVGAVQQRWHEDPLEHERALEEGVRLAADEGAELVCLQELTLSRYFAVDPRGPEGAGVEPEPLPGGPTHDFAARLARDVRDPDPRLPLRAGRGQTGAATTPRSWWGPTGELMGRTRKLHIPVTAGYHEDRYFSPGPPGGDAFQPVAVGGAKVGLPTCWDQWFPELARAYSLAGADLLVYPTAIGSEPDHPDFDTEPLWEQVIIGNAIANGLFMVAVNRFGEEPPLRFYGSSFICDPYGRKLVQAPRDEAAVLVADLDLDQRRDWLELFPFLSTRRPDAYGPLTDPPTRPGPGTDP